MMKTKFNVFIAVLLVGAVSAPLASAQLLGGGGVGAGGGGVLGIPQRIQELLLGSQNPTASSTHEPLKPLRPVLGDDSQMKNGVFCARIATASADMDAKIASKEAELFEKKIEKQGEREGKESEAEAARISRRDAWDENLSASVKALEARAATDREKAAVAVFKGAIDSALRERRTAIDAIAASFKAEAERANAERKAKLEAAVAAYKQALAAASAKAIADCTANPARAAGIRDAYRLSVKNAKDKFLSDRQTIEKAKISVPALSADRKAALQRINEEFRKKVQAALKTLRADFPKA
jgi:hypothetical protein